MRAIADRALVATGGAAGLLGVALSAAAAHVTGGGTLDVSARFLLAHAPVLLGLAALANGGVAHPRTARLAGLAVAVGLTLFSGDLAYRGFRSEALFAMAAPAGGIVLMVGWALVVLSALIGSRRIADADISPAAAPHDAISS